MMDADGTVNAQDLVERYMRASDREGQGLGQQTARLGWALLSIATGIALLAWLISSKGFLRWAYRGHRPNWIARILNRATAAAASAGVAPNILVTLEVTGRTSGRIISLPLVVVTVGGQRYVVSMLGNEVQWVRNVRAAGGSAVLLSGVREEVQLDEVPTDRRASILKAYLQRAPGARPHVPVNKDAAISDFEKVAAAFPIFRLVSKPVDAVGAA